MSVRKISSSLISNSIRSNSFSGPAAGAGGTPVDFLVIAGGGRGGSSAQNDYRFRGMGGGAGGYRCSIDGETSGGGYTGDGEQPIFLNSGDEFQVFVGAGSAHSGGGGADSFCGPIFCSGGGVGGSNMSTGSPGGSGGGSGNGAAGGTGITRQGFQGATTSSYRNGSPVAGGGAGSAGSGSTPGSGISSSITGSAVTRGAGGGAGNNASGAANTGNGGGGASTDPQRGGASGGSGVVILKYPTSMSFTIGAGLSSSTSTVGDYKVTTFTGGTGFVTVD